MSETVAPLRHPINALVVDRDDVDGIKAALRDYDEWAEARRASFRPMYEARDRLLERLAELEPMTLPSRRRQTDKQRLVDRCPRCRTEILR